MSMLSYVDPYSKYMDEEMDEDIWNKAQERFDFIYGREINSEIEYFACMVSTLQKRKQKMVRVIYEQMMEEKKSKP